MTKKRLKNDADDADDEDEKPVKGKGKAKAKKKDFVCILPGMLLNVFLYAISY